MNVGAAAPSETLAAAKAAATADPHALPDEPLLVALEELIDARRLIDVAIARYLAVVDVRDATIEPYGRTTRGWLIEDKHLPAATAGRLVKVSRQLPIHPVMSDALTAGEISIEHAAPILRTLAKLDPADRDVDEKILIEAAKDVDPDSLRQLCQATEEAACTNEDADARRERLHGSRYLNLSTTFDGMVRIEGMLEPDAGAAVIAAIEPLAQRLGSADDRTVPQRRADALATLAGAAAGFDDLLPDFNGDRPHLNVIAPYEKLVSDLDPHTKYDPTGAPTVNGIRVSPQTVRQLACDADILPVVMNSNSEVLDIGRATRIWPKAIRKALQIEDGGCGWPDCQMPLWACRIHHLTYWFHGGPTSKNNGVHLCRFHHWLVHHRDWKIWRDTITHKIRVART
ncbi:MAG TPA: DUF222 domain-containing protein [Mycobacteriales bacterium]|nr:DUF222 domain-containing protein [Mycobacteriales bacterium]